MKEIDAALAKGPGLSAAQLAEVKALRTKGEAEHNKGGSHAAAIATLAKAKEILGIMSPPKRRIPPAARAFPGFHAGDVLRGHPADGWRAAFLC